MLNNSFEVVPLPFGPRGRVQDPGTLPYVHPGTGELSGNSCARLNIFRTFTLHSKIPFFRNNVQ